MAEVVHKLRKLLVVLREEALDHVQPPLVLVRLRYHETVDVGVVVDLQTKLEYGFLQLVEDGSYFKTETI